MRSLGATGWLMYWVMMVMEPASLVIGILSGMREGSRTDRVLSIELVGPVTALARLQCSIAPKHFIDLLTLLWLDGRWQIVSKVFHYDIRG